MPDTKKPTRNGLVSTSKIKKKTAPTKKPSKIKQRSLEDISNMEEPIYLAKPHKPKGRPKNENYISYVEAREFVRGELIPSRTKFHEWHDRNKPKAIPRFPYRIYTEEWVSWNDFLGTNNEFGGKSTKAWRKYEEAVTWANTLKIESYGKWMEYCKTNTLPSDIPARPDLSYPGWKTWGHWLGNKSSAVIENIRAAQKIQIYYIIHDPSMPENVLNFGVDTQGPTAFKERWKNERFNVVKTFWYDSAEAESITNIVNHFSTPYLGDDSQRICYNVWEIIYYLAMRLETVTNL